jgi:NAD(P)H dehydrogenase (quinone)
LEDNLISIFCNWKMNVLIVLGHPDSNSFNHALAETCKVQIEKNGHSVCFHDLYKEKFDPVLHIESSGRIPVDETVKKHYEELVNCDGIIIIHPNWWGQPPAIVKGWIDRVFLQDVAYKFEINNNGEHAPVGLLKAKTGLILNTSNTSEEVEKEVYKNTLELIWKNKIFKICGIDQVERINFQIVKESCLKERLVWLSQVREMMDSYFPKA